MISPRLLSMLWCPACQASHLQSAASSDRAPGVPAPGVHTLICPACEASFPVQFGFPTLIPEDSLTGAEWQEWRDHLEKFRARRMARVENPNETIVKLAGKSRPQPSFAEFIRIDRGMVLDIGCGPGKFRHLLDPSRVEYIGLDPMPLPEVSDFPFVQGLAEYIPFKDKSFTDVVVLAALDHFRNLDRFLDEARRVLVPRGRLHVMQSVHEVRGPVSAVRVLAHKVKDDLEERRYGEHGRDVPKHLSEFTTRSLIDRLSRSFDVASVGRYSGTWYSPTKLFLSFEPKQARMPGLTS